MLSSFHQYGCSWSNHNIFCAIFGSFIYAHLCYYVDIPVAIVFFLRDCWPMIDDTVAKMFVGVHVGWSEKEKKEKCDSQHNIFEEILKG